jgi:type 2 lantibiotic biosynthesis protein LanM
MGGAPGQLTPFALLATENYGTDEMRYARKRMALGSSPNRPVLNGREIRLLDQAEDFIQGFSSMYRMIIKHRDELLSANSPIYCFANDEVRLIVRATKSYVRLLQESYHPDLLRNALDRDQLLDRLWVGIDARPEIAHFIPFEHSALQKGDIPIFSSRPSSKNLCSANGDLIEGLLEETTLAAVLKRLQLLAEDDLRRQVWFIRSSLAATGSGPGHTLVRTDLLSEEAAGAVCRRDFLAAASEIGDHLIEISSSAGDLMTWTGLSMLSEKTWSIAPMASDLYSGLAGIALFFAYLGRLSNDDRYSTTARLAVETAKRQLKETRMLIGGRGSGIGAFSGDSGLLYTLTHLGQLWREPVLWEEAEELIASLPEGIARDQAFDIMAGAAGYLCVLCDFYRITQSSIARQSALACAEHLLANGRVDSEGIAWLSPESIGPLTGFSHGVSGIAYALLRAGELTGNERFYRAALEGIRYERTHFIQAEKNWQDLRQLSDSSSQEPRVMTAWCHGAPGIGLTRLHSFIRFGEEDLRREFEIALETTAQKGFGASHCLCHGDLGNLDLLIEAGRLPDYRRWGKIARDIGGKLLKMVPDRGWLCSTPNGVETPGLMLGLSGIGYGLLRLVDPEFVPSILSLQPPSGH